MLNTKTSYLAMVSVSSVMYIYYSADGKRIRMSM